MSVRDRLKIAYYTNFLKPAADRPLFQAIREGDCRRMLLFGLGTGQRATRMVELARLAAATDEKIEFVGIDPFESRNSADGPGITLMLAHRLLKATQAQIRLIPGDPVSALAQYANHLGQFDLVVISAEQKRNWSDRASFFLPRVLHAGSQVFEEQTEGGKSVWRRFDAEELNQLRQKAGLRPAA